MIEPLYHQVIKGNKTQTRRASGLELVNDTSLQMNGRQRSPDDWIYCKGAEGKGYNDNYPQGFITSVMFAQKAGVGKFVAGTEITCTPRYKVGEVLYLKEPMAEDSSIYKYDHPLQGRELLTWSNKLFMPASAARAFVRIIGIKCERLLDISDADTLAEGIEIIAGGDISYTDTTKVRHTISGPFYKIYGGGANQRCKVNPSAKKSFLSLYKFANKVKDVQNIWCWVYEFEYLPNYKIS